MKVMASWNLWRAPRFNTLLPLPQLSNKSHFRQSRVLCSFPQTLFVLFLEYNSPTSRPNNLVLTKFLVFFSKNIYIYFLSFWLKIDLPDREDSILS